MNNERKYRRKKDGINKKKEESVKENIIVNSEDPKKLTENDKDKKEEINQEKEQDNIND